MRKSLCNQILIPIQYEAYAMFLDLGQKKKKMSLHLDCHSLFHLNPLPKVSVWIPMLSNSRSGIELKVMSSFLVKLNQKNNEHKLRHNFFCPEIQRYPNYD